MDPHRTDFGAQVPGAEGQTDEAGQADIARHHFHPLLSATGARRYHDHRLSRSHFCFCSLHFYFEHHRSGDYYYYCYCFYYERQCYDECCRD